MFLPYSLIASPPLLSFDPTSRGRWPPTLSLVLLEVFLVTGASSWWDLLGLSVNKECGPDLLFMKSEITSVVIRFHSNQIISHVKKRVQCGGRQLPSG